MKDYQELYGRTRDRAEPLQGGFDRIGRAPAAALLGLLAVAACRLFGYEPTAPVRWAILATTPLALVLLVYGWLRLPLRGKFSLRALGAILATLVLAAAALYFGRAPKDGARGAAAHRAATIPPS